MSKEVYIIDGVRTAIGNLGGTLSSVRADDLAANVIKALMDKHPNLNPLDLEGVVFGCANQAGEDNRNIARMAGLLAGLPSQVSAETVNILCASGMAATINATRAIKDGCGDLFIAGGVEHMTRGPWVISKTSTAYGREAKTAVAMQSGRLAEEIIPVIIPQKKKEPILFSVDEFARPETTLESLGALRPAFKKDGSVTAGNSSGLNDGAAAILLASGDAVAKYSLKPLARIVCAASAGVEPRIMGIGPVEAIKKVLDRSGLTLDQMDVLELNEAFAAQVLACTRALGIADDDQRINPNGGAISLGHPLGMTGARILYTAALELQKTKKRYALVSMCIGVGQGYATILERV